MSVYISVVIPVYNSRDTLEILCKRISFTFEKMNSVNYEIILVDDGSQDSSYEKMVEIYHKNSNVSIIQLSQNFGQQNAIMCGLNFARGEYVVTLDDDFQHPPEEIIKLLDKIKKGYDVVFGIPINKKHSYYRNTGTKLISILFNKVCRKPKDVEVSSFRIIQKAVAKEIIRDKRSFVYLAPIIFKITTNVEMVSVRHDARKYGQSNYTFIKLVTLLGKLIIYYTNMFKIAYLSSKPQYEIKDLKFRGDYNNEAIDSRRK